MQPRVDGLDLALFALFDDGIDLVEEPGADENRALVALPQRACVADTCRIELDLEAFGGRQLVERQLIGGRRNRRRRDRRELGVDRRIGSLRAGPAFVAWWPAKGQATRRRASARPR